MPKIPQYLYHVIFLRDWQEIKNKKCFNIKEKNHTIHLFNKEELDKFQKSMHGLPNLLILTIRTKNLPIAYVSEDQCKKFYQTNQPNHYHIPSSAIILTAIEKIDLVENHAFESPDKYGLSLRGLTREADHRCTKQYKEKELKLSPLHTAAYNGSLKNAKALLKKIDVNSTDIYGWTPIA